MKRKKVTSNNKVKLTLISLGVVLLIAVPVVISLFYYNIFGKSVKSGELIAKVNDEKIYKSEVEAKLRELLRNDISKVDLNSLPPEILEVVVKNIYVERELDKKIKKEKLLNSREIKKKTEEYALRLARQSYLELMIKKNVTPEAVRNRYSELNDEIKGKKEVHLKHIVLKTDKEAKKVAKELKSKSFEVLAKKYSIDTQTAKQGGDLGYVIEDNIVKDFANFISSAKKGSVSLPIKSKFGWHIIKIFDIREAKAMPFESVKNEIEEELKRKETEKFFNEIAGNIKVEIIGGVNQKDAAQATNPGQIEMKPGAVDEPKSTVKNSKLLDSSETK